MADDTRTCSICFEVLPLTRFEKTRTQCKLCRSRRREAGMSPDVRAAKYAYRREYARLNKETVKATDSRWRAYNRERVNANQRAAWARRDKSKELATRAAWTAKNRDRIAAANAAWYQANLDKAKEARQRRRAHLKAVQSIPFTAEQLQDRLAYYGFRCWMCGGPYEHLDHVKPVSKGGPHMLANFRPACHGCNIRKRDRWDGPKALGL